ncbi:baseplate J/gp47 family protein [Azospirillum sp. TSH64]|uniref:baseplate assembly protein n=1 Tax=Azospirillum sp. TSH64 TaxID=652740 RepID=UPI000D620237|nr:baseplate J/gp47 family protein [Azospirillum sp. TSH64]PWC81252.1 hypothetical protein TSH64_00995 [Azospirillum sp. TSH64]
MALDLSSLPAPGVVEELSFEAIVASMIRELVARDPAYAALLESDPAIKLLEVAASRELLLRQRINDAVRATLLAFAGGGDLDNLAAFYGVVRLPDESDVALRARVVEATQGSSAAGGAAHYRRFARGSDPRVKDAAVESLGPGDVTISILSTEGDGAATAELLEAVRAVVLRDDVRVLTDTVSVVPATVVPATISADIWLLPDTPTAVFDGLEAGLRAAFAKEAGLGWDLTRSWLVSKLHVGGVHKVELASPGADIVANGTTSVAIGSVALRLAGRRR